MSASKQQAGTISSDVPPRSSWIRWAWRVALFLAAAFILLFTVPWMPANVAPTGGFDFSWMLLVHDAVASGRQFGTQIILPQGPTAFLGNSAYDPRTYWILVSLRSLIALATLAALWEAARRFIRRPLMSLLWFVAIVALIGRTPDHFFPAIALLLPVSYFAVHDRRVTASVIGLVIVVGVASLIKLNQPFCAVVGVGAVAVDQVLRRREARGKQAHGSAREPAGSKGPAAPAAGGLSDRPAARFVVPAVYIGTVVVSYLAARQSPSSIGPFLWGWYLVTVGHLDCVGLPGPLVDALEYLAVVALVSAPLAIYAWRRWRWAGSPLLGGTLGVLLLLYKHSFVRQDMAHVHIGPIVALAAAILYVPIVWSAGSFMARGLIVTAVAIAMAVTTSILSSYTGEGLPAYAVRVAQRCGDNASAAAGLSDPGWFGRRREDARRKLRDEFPLPLAKIEGSVDVYPHRQDVVFAYGLDYQPRPVVSSLVATAPELAELNAAHLRGASAARTVLFDFEPVDDNFPTTLDGASWPELLTRYDVIDSSGAMLVLRRTASPRTYRLRPLAARTARFDEPVPVPEADSAPLWAYVHFRPRRAGKVLSALYKPPTLGIGVRTRSQKDTWYRLLPTLADRQGFLLSPLIDNRAAFAQLASKSWSRDLLRARVDTITISVADGSQDSSFDPEFTVEFDRLEFSRP